MAAFHAFRPASRLYASYYPTSSGLRLASSSTGTRGFPQTYTFAKASTSELAPKPFPRKETPKEYLSQSTLSGIKISRQKASDKRIPSQKPVLKSDPKPMPKAVLAAPQYPPRPKSRPPPTPTEYKSHRERMKKEFPQGWAPPRTISREAMEVLRALHAEDPVQYRTPVLASKFRISPEAVSRILKSKWRPAPERIEKAIARDNLNKDKWMTEKIRAERAEMVKSLEGRLDIVEKARGKDKLTMK